MKAIKTTIVISLCMFLIMGCISPELRTARIAVNEKDWNRAIKALETEAERNPINAEAFYLMGLCYEKRSDWVNMSLNYEKSLAISDLFKDKIDKSRKRLVIKYQNSSIISWDAAKSMKASGEKGGAEAILSRALEYIARELDAYFNGLVQEIGAKYGERVAETVRTELEKANILSSTKQLLESVRTVRDKENAVALLLGYFADWAQAVKDGTNKLGMLNDDDAKAVELTINRLREAKIQAEKEWKAEGGFELLNDINKVTAIFSAEFSVGTSSGSESNELEIIDLSEYKTLWEKAATGVTDASDVYRTSLASLDTAIIIDPHNRDLYVRAAVIASDGGLSDEAIKYSQQAIDLETEGKHDPAMRAIQMQAYRQKGDDEEVIKWAKETMRVIDIDNDPQNLYLQAFDELINAYETKGEVELAAQATQETLAKFPENLLLKKNLAIFMVRRKDYDSAMKIYEDVLKQVPDDLDANLTIGTILCNQDKYSEAISYLIKAHEADPENFAAVTNLMSAYYNTDQDEKGGEMRNKLKALTSGE